jgi:hypothetical protein
MELELLAGFLVKADRAHSTVKRNAPKLKSKMLEQLKQAT